MDAFDHHRRSIRLRGYDYSRQGAYFITLCASQRRKLFGNIVDGRMVLSPAGKMLETLWYDIPRHYAGIGIDAFVVMPNHIHGIVIVGAGPRACPARVGTIPETGQPQGVAPTVPLSLPNIVHRYKTITTRRYILGINQYRWPAFDGKLWQRNYYEHIIRNETSLEQIRMYIENNPANWTKDSLFI